MSGIRAKHFNISALLKLVGEGVAQLPEFQRDVVWNAPKVRELLQAVLDDRPIGCLLILQVDANGDAPFDPRMIEGAQPSTAKSVKFLILDGQQRITALWNSLRDTEKKKRFFICYNADSLLDGTIVTQPVRKFHEQPKACLSKGLIPLWLLLESNKAVRWIDEAMADDQGRLVANARTKLATWLTGKAEQLSKFEIPYLLLPASTPETQAIETFIKSNTNSLNLKKFDIATAEALQLKFPSLRLARSRAWNELTELKRYLDHAMVGDLLLKVACLRTNQIPVERNYSNEDVLREVSDNLDQILEGIRWTVELLQSEQIWDRRRLPSVVPFRVLPAVYPFIPIRSKQRGPTIKTARAYLWRSFLTTRYKSSAANLLKEDFDALRKVIQGNSEPNSVPIWSNRLPDIELLKASPWPTSNSSLSKSILALSLRRGALDIGSGERIQQNRLDERQHHHIFPEDYLIKNAPEGNPHLALNCMLITGRTNKEASNKPPLEYLKSLVTKHAGSSINLKELKWRVESHLVPFESLEIKNKSVMDSYMKFLDDRSRLIERDIDKLANGDEPLILDLAIQSS